VRGARRCKSLIYNNLESKNRDTKQQHESHGERLHDECHSGVCHSVLCHTECSIVLAGCAIADSIFVCKDGANVIVKILVVLEVLL